MLANDVFCAVVWGPDILGLRAYPVALDQALLFQTLVLGMAAGVDFVVGDPWGWYHPVQAMGAVITAYSQRVLDWEKRWQLPPVVMKLAGVGLGCLLVLGSGGLSWLGLQGLGLISPWLRYPVELVLLASCFAGRSLRRAAEDVLAVLHDLPVARDRLAMYVGRDTQQLSRVDIQRAVLETVSENAIDGVLAPLFYALVGACFGAAAPLTLAYKAASTLDSMVGYRTAPYRDLGWFSAQFEDVLTWLPCRLSVLMVAVLSVRFAGRFAGQKTGWFSGHIWRSPPQVLRLCWRDARSDPSPNAGWSECAYAAALGVQLGGANTYRGQLKVKPLLGDDSRPITPKVIDEALWITRWCFLIGLGLGMWSVVMFATIW